MALAWVVGAGPVGAQELIDMPGEDRPLTADFEEVYRIGSLDGDAWETFGEIGGTAFDAAGNLYVFDRQGNRITMVDREGRFVREIGHAGEGPGEFRMALQFTVMRDGRLVVADLGHRAYQLFDANGEYERMVSMGGDMGSLRLGDLAPHPGGDAVISGGSGMVIATAGGLGGAAGEPETRPIDLISLTGDEISIRVIAEGWKPPRGEPTTLEGGGMQFRMDRAGPRTFEPGLFVGALPDGGVVFSDSSAYSLKVVGPDGGVTRVLRRPFHPEPVTDAIEKAEKERRLAELEAGEGPRITMRMVDGSGGGARTIGGDQMQAIMQSQIDQMQFFGEMSVVTGLQTSWTGKVWVQRRGEGTAEDGPIDVLTTQGQYMGTFAAGVTEIPSSFGPDGMAAYIERDEFDVPSVVVRRLPPVLN